MRMMVGALVVLAAIGCGGSNGDPTCSQIQTTQAEPFQNDCIFEDSCAAHAYRVEVDTDGTLFCEIIGTQGGVSISPEGGGYSCVATDAVPVFDACGFPHQ